MTHKERKRQIENLISDVDDVIAKLEKQIERPTGLFEKEKATDVYNQLLHAYSVKTAIILNCANLCLN